MIRGRRLILAVLAAILTLTLGVSLAAAEPRFLAGQAHVQSVGWMDRVGGETATGTIGTIGRALRMEAIRLDGMPLSVRAHVQDLGWTGWVGPHQVAGTTGRALRLEAVRVRSDVAGVAVECRAHVQDLGWTGWVADGAVCGTTGQSKRLEAVQLRIAATTATPTPSPTPTAGRDSNRPVDQTQMLAGYTLLAGSQQGRTIIAASDALTVQINRVPDVVRDGLAVRDADNTRLTNVSQAFPPRLKGALDDLTREGRLPRFRELLAGGAVAMQTPSASSSAAKDHYRVVRPVNWTGSPIRRVPDAGDAYNVGDSYSFPSGHARTQSVVAASLAIMLPEVAPQVLARGADAGHSRIVLGVHTPLDVIAGKAVGIRMVAQRLDDPAFRRDVFEPAMTELRAGLEAKCGTTIAVCAEAGPDAAAATEYRQRLTYGLPRLGTPGVPLVVPAGAEALLTYSHPDLTQTERRQIIAQTAIDSGYPLDLTGHQSGEHVGWTRIDLAAALGDR